jgi:YHS domain-containing protein
MPVDQKLANVSADRMRQPANQHPGRTGHGSRATVLDETVTDPVCGMTVDPATTPHRYQHQKRTYYFCSANCRTKFAADPIHYLADKAAPAQAVSKGTIYTCPMHPEIRQAGPGSCPICGMALEPVLATADTGPNAELVDMTRRFWIGLVLTLPVFVLEMGSHQIFKVSSIQACRAISSSPLRRLLCCGPVGHFSCEAHSRSLRAISTCSR